jgi:hypothetical protein
VDNATRLPTPEPSRAETKFKFSHTPDPCRTESIVGKKQNLL